MEVVDKLKQFSSLLGENETKYIEVLKEVAEKLNESTLTEKIEGK